MGGGGHLPPAGGSFRIVNAGPASRGRLACPRGLRPAPRAPLRPRRACLRLSEPAHWHAMQGALGGPLPRAERAALPGRCRRRRQRTSRRPASAAHRRRRRRAAAGRPVRGRPSLQAGTEGPLPSRPNRRNRSERHAPRGTPLVSPRTPLVSPRTARPSYPLVRPSWRTLPRGVPRAPRPRPARTLLFTARASAVPAAVPAVWRRGRAGSADRVHPCCFRPWTLGPGGHGLP